VAEAAGGPVAEAAGGGGPVPGAVGGGGPVPGVVGDPVAGAAESPDSWLCFS
jgi:hypothetical protein